MKAQILIIFLAVVNINMYAQISKGRQMIGFHLQFSKAADVAFDSSGTNPRIKQTSIGGGIGLRYGIFITDKIMLGVAGSINGNNSHSESINYLGDVSFQDQYSDNTSAGIFGRYYKMLGKSKFAGIGQLNINYNIGQTTNKYSSIWGNSKSSNKNSGISAFLSAGLGYFLNKNIGLEIYLGSVGFTNFKSANFSNGIKNSERKSFQFYSYSLFPLSSINLGLNFYFGGKNKAAETTATAP